MSTTQIVKYYIRFYLLTRFSEEYFANPYRGYGGGIITVFTKLRDTEYSDPYKPASEQFDGAGSYGNGGAMRIVPAPLFAYKQNDVEKLTVSVNFEMCIPTFRIFMI